MDNEPYKEGRGGVLAAMSGGVDSSVAALILKNQGYRVVGATMRLLETIEESFAPARSCCSADDIMDARHVALKLDFDHKVHNFSLAFRSEVIERFARDYFSGRTPNPCVDCNRRLKFSLLFQRAVFFDCAFMATGHYARVELDKRSGRWLLKKALDLDKDQSYFLYGLTQKELSRTLFPLGSLTKKEVRALALSHNLVTAQKPESQDICFVRTGRYDSFLESFGLKAKPGDIVDRRGRLLGHHKGLHRYTVGQRKGLGLCAPNPLYVAALDSSTNRVIVGREEELYSSSAIVSEVNFISVAKLSGLKEIEAKIRYRQNQFPALIEPLEPGPDRVRLIFNSPQRAVAPGQAAVFYQGDLVIGGGTIESAELI
ncbi:MAG: tRNA 2-thiouridine(34) synthase MnmA [Deltaproteobacteria bacterium]|jgi:tRNA-specific 2-thiouridylase|nr:tRNA 2-thiouridine(34) synthase MnmA [Deltaproteobacteria bacterium]